MKGDKMIDMHIEQLTVVWCSLGPGTTLLKTSKSDSVQLFMLMVFVTLKPIFFHNPVESTILKSRTLYEVRHVPKMDLCEIFKQNQEGTDQV